MTDPSHLRTIPLEGVKVKYRLIELLRCPEHPQEILRVTSAHVSEVFPCAFDIQAPICRSGCGLMGNWFSDIPQNLPSSHRLDCRRCFGMEIETAELTCPECGWSLEVEGGVLGPNGTKGPGSSEPETELPTKVGLRAEKLLDLHTGDLTLLLASMPEAVFERWGGQGIERLHVEMHPETLAAHRARACAHGQGLAYYLAGPMDISVFRPGQFDSVITMFPTDKLASIEDTLENLPALMRPSGRILMIFDKKRKGSSTSAKEFLESHPEAFGSYRHKVESHRDFDLLLLEPSEPSPVVLNSETDFPDL